MRIKRPINFKVLSISTGHITESDGKLLTDIGDKHQTPDTSDPIIYSIFDNTGSLVSCYCGSADASPHHRFSGAFNNIMAWARKHKYDYVIFSADGHIYKDLPQYDW